MHRTITMHALSRQRDRRTNTTSVARRFVLTNASHGNYYIRIYKRKRKTRWDLTSFRRPLCFRLVWPRRSTFHLISMSQAQPPRYIHDLILVKIFTKILYSPSFLSHWPKAIISTSTNQLHLWPKLGQILNPLHWVVRYGVHKVFGHCLMPTVTLTLDLLA